MPPPSQRTELGLTRREARGLPPVPLAQRVDSGRKGPAGEPGSGPRPWKMALGAGREERGPGGVMQVLVEGQSLQRLPCSITTRRARL